MDDVTFEIEHGPALLGTGLATEPTSPSNVDTTGTFRLLINSFVVR